MGRLLEGVIRKREVNISALARALQVNRRSVYNWFKESELSPELLKLIAEVIDHDFSEEFPLIFQKKPLANPLPAKVPVEKNEDYWKNKYIALLERYSELLAEKKIY